MNLSARKREQYLDAAKLAGQWFVNTQNTNQNPWGGVRDSADLGRFLYEYFPATGDCRGMCVWGQSIAVSGLIALARRFNTGMFLDAAKQGGEYLKSLQIINTGDPVLHGCLRESSPQSTWTNPRDGGTGVMGLLALFRDTGDEQWLEHARLFGEWYHSHGSDQDHWPYYQYDIAKRTGERVGKEGDSNGRLVRYKWRAAGGLFYYWLYRLTSEEKWLDYFKILIDQVEEVYEQKREMHLRHHPSGEKGVIINANDDFAFITLLAAYRLWKKETHRAYLQDYMHRLWEVQEQDGSYPGLEGVFVATLSNMEYLRLCREEGIDENLEELEKRIIKSADFALTLQETKSRDIRSYGGFYGQSHYNVSRDCIHSRGTGYGLIMFLRLEGEMEIPYYSAWGWDN